MGYQVQYVPLITHDGSGEPQSLAGGASLSIVVHAPTHDGDYHPTHSPADPSHTVAVAGFRGPGADGNGSRTPSRDRCQMSVELTRPADRLLSMEQGGGCAFADRVA